jgi:hypothetical protein
MRAKLKQWCENGLCAYPCTVVAFEFALLFLCLLHLRTMVSQLGHLKALLIVDRACNQLHSEMTSTADLITTLEAI